MYHEYYDKYKGYLNQSISYDSLIKEANDELDKCNVDFETLKQTQQLLQLLKSKKISSKRDKILNLINKALVEIFEKDYELKIESNEKLDDIKYDLVLYKNGIEISKNDSLLNSNGGGVLSVISVLFKIVIGILHNNEKLFIFDESLAQVSSLYRPKLSSYIRNLCESQGLTLILVSHVDDMDFAAHKTYYLNGKIKKGIDTLFVEKVEEKYGSYIPKDKYLVDIQQFQSIENLQLEFGGYTMFKGPNDIGKSAIIRAISSLLNNSFSDSDVRKNKPKGVNTTINFKKVSSNVPEYDIELKFENNSVFYTINGVEYKGKRNSSSSIKEAFNKLGFNSFVDDSYLKNKSVKTREQLSQLTITTQHDSLYIVENNVNENTTLFAYIFNAHTVTNATMLVKTDIKNINNKINELTIKIKEYSDKKNVLSKFERLYYCKYIVSLHKIYTEQQGRFAYLNKVQQIYTQLAQKYSLLFACYDYNIKYTEFEYKQKLFKHLETYSKCLNDNLGVLIAYKDVYLKSIECKSLVDELNKKVWAYNKILVLIDSLKLNLEKSIAYKMYCNLQFFKKREIKFITYFEYVHKILELYKKSYSYKVEDSSNEIFNYKKSKEKLIPLVNIFDKLSKEEKLVQHLKGIYGNLHNVRLFMNLKLDLNSKQIVSRNIDNEIILLKEEFGICKCDKCNGIGYIFS